MAVALPAIVGALSPNLSAAGLIGTDTPKLATGVANGLQQWIPTIQAMTVDTGSLGVGSGGPMPLLVPQPTIFGALSSTVPSAGFAGTAAPQLITGLANGLAQAFLQMMVLTQHPGIGVGSAVVTFLAPPASGPMTAGFAAASLAGEAAPRLATAVGLALDIVFASLVMTVPIVGSASPTGGAGTGTGKIL